MGVSPWSDPLTLWRQKMDIVDTTFETAAMTHGRDNEGIARDKFNAMMGFNFQPEVVTHPTKPYMIASLDGRDGDRIIEIKCPKSIQSFVQMKDHVPEHYMYQVQAQLAVTGLKQAFFVAYFDDEIIFKTVERDEEMIEEIYKAVDEFYRRMVDFDPPPSKVFQIEDGRWKTLAVMYKTLSAEKKEAERMLDEIKEEMIELSTHDSQESNDVRLTRYVARGSVQYAKIPELKGIDLDQYRGEPKEIWKITIQ